MSSKGAAGMASNIVALAKAASAAGKATYRNAVLPQQYRVMRTGLNMTAAFTVTTDMSSVLLCNMAMGG